MNMLGLGIFWTSCYFFVLDLAMGGSFYTLRLEILWHAILDFEFNECFFFFFLVLWIGDPKPWNGTRPPPSLTLVVEATPSPWVKGPLIPFFFMF